MKTVLQKISLVAVLALWLSASQVSATAHLEVSLEGPSGLKVGQTDITYTITLRNAGSTDITDIKLEFPIPSCYRLSASKAYVDEEEFGFNFAVENDVLVATAPGQILYGPPYYESIVVAITFDITGDIYYPVALNQVTASGVSLGETLVATSNRIKATVDAQNHICLLEEPRISHESAANAQDGSIALLLSGGTGLYQVIAKNLSSGNSVTVEGEVGSETEVGPLEPGIYELEIIDSEGNTRTFSAGSSFTRIDPWKPEAVEAPAAVTAPVVEEELESDEAQEEEPIALEPLVIQSVSKDASSITIVATGGSGQLSYSINGGRSFSTNNVFTKLTAGTYDIVVIDQLGTSVTQVEKISAPQVTIKPIPTTVKPKPVTQSVRPKIVPQKSTLKIVSTQKRPSRKNMPTGSISIKATGGSAPLSYSINGGATFNSTGMFGGLRAGTYRVVVKDSKGLRISASAQVGVQG